MVVSPTWATGGSVFPVLVSISAGPGTRWCHGLKRVPWEATCRGPNPQHLGMWPHVWTVLLWMCLVKTRPGRSRAGPNAVLIKGGHLDTDWHAYTTQVKMKHRRGRFINKPREAKDARKPAAARSGARGRHPHSLLNHLHLGPLAFRTVA